MQKSCPSARRRRAWTKLYRTHVKAQDWGKVKVTKCMPKSNGNTIFVIMNVTIYDEELKASYHRDIKIIPVGKAYLIDDVLEFD
jgi:hypothetical protein